MIKDFIYNDVYGSIIPLMLICGDFGATVMAMRLRPNVHLAQALAKEISIRKVLGASLAGLAGLLTREFVQLVALSCIIAFPVARWAISDWLQNYAYSISIHCWVFAVAGLAALVVALITVSFQAIRAAVANPAKVLKEM